MQPCTGVCAYEGENTSSSIFIMVLADKDLLSAPQADVITSKIAVMLSRSQFQGYLLVCSGVHSWQTSYQGFGWVWILSCPSVDGTASNTLLSRVAPGQRSASGSTLQSSDVLLPSTQVDIATAMSLWMFLLDCWIGPWLRRTGSGLWLRLAGTNPQRCFRFHSPDRGLQIWLWRH